MKKIICYHILIFIMLYSCSSQDELSKINAVFSEFNTRNEDYRKAVQKNLEKLKNGEKIPEVIKYSQRETEYMENNLIPIFPLVREQICLHHNDEVFEELMKIMINTSNSAEEELSRILGEVYICRPDFVVDFVSKQKEYDYLMREVDFGFLNFKHSNYDQELFPTLKAKLDSVNTIKPFRNH